ncbi:MAG: hypothetical protein ACLQBD_30470 [Syntrophobacteraceae bacterium]
MSISCLEKPEEKDCRTHVEQTGEQVLAFAYPGHGFDVNGVQRENQRSQPRSRHAEILKDIEQKTSHTYMKQDIHNMIAGRIQAP